jgi:hypothetical protein
MPVITKLRRGKLRTIYAKTGHLARTKLGNPVDGGGWKPTKTGRATAARQAGYINEA